MNSVQHTIKEAISKGKNERIKHIPIYKGFIIYNNKTIKGYKLSGYNYKTDVHINALYSSFEAIKKVIDCE